MKPVWKNTIKCTAFILILILILSAASCFYRPRSVHADYDLNHYHYYGIFGEPENTLDALILGDSLSYMALSPMEMWEQQGFTAFTCGNAMQSIRRSYENLWYILKDQSPRLVVLECNFFYNTITREDLFRTRLGMALPVFSFHDMWRKTSKDVLLGGEFPEYIDDAKGYYPWDEVVPCETPDYMVPTEEREQIARANLECMDAIAKLCRESGAQLLIISVPSALNWTYARHNAVQDYADSLGVPYWDFNLSMEEIGLDWSKHSWDGGDHLNLEGGVILSRYLADRLAREYDLPDHRGDPAYDQWNVSAENYHSWVAEDINHRFPPLREVEQKNP